LGLAYVEVDGLDVEAVWEAAHQAIKRARDGQGPTFLHAHCVHLEAHFLGYQVLRATRSPLRELPAWVGPLVRSSLRFGGASLRDRWEGMKVVVSSLWAALRDPRRSATSDPVERTRAVLMSAPARLRELERILERETAESLARALEERPK
jgi:pyruvate dehydrogenase E1 component alpha subunit